MKPSKYNHFCVIDGSNYLINYRTRSILKLNDKNTYEALKVILNYENNQSVSPVHKGIDDNIIDITKANGFLLDDDENEIDELKVVYRASFFDNSYIRLILLPTLLCNFDCPYCFENKTNKIMGEETAKALVNWFEKKVAQKKKAHIAWFGGEPLLNFKRMRVLSSHFGKACQKYGVNFDASITTNGYLMNNKVISFFNELSISHVQITLDGNREYHDRYRCLRNGKPTFNKIIENACNLVNFSKPSLSIRFNCSDENFESIFAFLETGPEELKAGSSIFFRWIYSSKAKNYKEFSSTLKGTKPYLNLHKLYIKALQEGWVVRNPHSRIKYGYCEVDYRDHYLIDPIGQIFLCSHSMDKEDSIGTVFETELSDHAERKIAKWYSFEPFDDEKCCNCKLLPICWGGCRLQRFEGKRGCIEEAKSLEDYAASFVLQFS